MPVQSSPQSHHSSHSPQKHKKRKYSESDDQNDSLDDKDYSLKHQNQSYQNQTQSMKSQLHNRRQKRSRSRERSHKHKHHKHHKDKDSQFKQSDKKQFQKNQKFQNADSEYKQESPTKKHKQNAHRNQTNLQFYDHLYFLEDEHSKVSVQTAIWNTIILHGLRPKKIIIVCQNYRKITKLIKCSSVNRKYVVIDHDSKQDITLLTRNYDIVIMTQQKSSITLGLDQGDIALFDLVINYGKSYSVEYYSLLPQFLGDHGIIFTIFQEKKELERHEKKLKINLKQIGGIQISKAQVQKQIFNQIQLQSKKPRDSKGVQPIPMEDLNLLKSLPFSLQQISVRLFHILQQRYSPKTSIYGNRQGYLTFCLKTDTQFNSIKYIWNFIRQEMSPSIVKNIRDMKKFQNQRGVLFNIPMGDLNKWQSFQSKIQKNQKKYKGYKLYEWLNTQLPKLQDTESQEYKILQQKKQDALKKRYQLQLFIAGVPYDVNQVEIRKYFSDRHINLFMIRILRDGSGFSKGIAFGLAQNQEHFQRALKLNGQKFGDRQLRIKLADQRDNK